MLFKYFKFTGKRSAKFEIEKLWIENKFLVMKTLFDFGFINKTGKENKCQFSTINMATTTIATPNIEGPEKFDGTESKLEEFIKNFDRYAQIIGLAEERKVIVVAAYLTSTAVLKYDEAPGITFDEKLKAAFTKPKTILDIMNELVNLRLESQDPDFVFKKADELIEKLCEKKIGKKELSNLVYMNVVDDYEVKRELVLRGTSDTKDIKDIVKRVHKLKKMNEESVAAYTTNDNKWKTVEKKKYQPRQETRQVRRDMVQENKRQIHPTHFIVRCWACHKEGHVRRECPEVKCSFCHKKGHYRSQCYENPHRFEEKAEYRRRKERIGNKFNSYRSQSRGPKEQRYSAAVINENEYDSPNEMQEMNKMYGKTEFFNRNYQNSEDQYDGNQGNEDARSKREVISVLN